MRDNNNNPPVWNHPVIKAAVTKKGKDNNLRFRQHVHPFGLSTQWEVPCIQLRPQ
jgi:hypothetical protein